MGCCGISSETKNKVELIFEQNKLIIEQINSNSSQILSSINKINDTLTNINDRLKSGIGIESDLNNNNLINNNEEKINIIFKYEGEKINIPIKKNRKFIDAIKMFQEKKISCNNIDKIKIIYNGININDRVFKNEEIISNIINANSEVIIYY